MIKGTSIEERPDDINFRIEFGHWEGDTIVCKDNLQCLFTLVEGVTRFGIIKKIKTKSPACILKAMQQIKYEVGDLMFGRIFKSITFDNGVKFNCHKEIEAMGVKVYFTPHITMWFKYNRYDDYPYFPFDPITKENVEQLKKYGKAHIVYSLTKNKWVVSDKFKQ